MDISKAFLVLIVTYMCSILSYSYVLREDADIQLKLLRQEHVPSIEYKYVVKAILPTENRWWRRGTHRFYTQESKPKITES